MKKIYLFILACIFLFACNTRRQVEQAVSYGNYDNAIATSIQKLSANKDAKRKQDYIVMLRDAYAKATSRDLETIEHLKQSGNNEMLKDIFELYVNLDNRQESIKPLLPLTLNGKKVTFNFNDYSTNIASARNNVSNYIYDNALNLLESNNKVFLRQAFNELNYLEQINPNFENTRELITEAHQRGMDYIIVSINNDTQQFIPSRLEAELLDFNTYGLNKLWTTYHSNRLPNLKYDYAMQLNLKVINISPEGLREREVIRENKVKDGWEYQLDSNGNVVKDSLGNDIKLDKIVNVKCSIKEITQFKSSQIIGDVVYVDLRSKQKLDTFPIDSSFIFENVFANISGDERALIKEDRLLLNRKSVPFPTNEQMIYDTGENLKVQLKNIINGYAIAQEKVY